jgi:hypothetical protein
VDHEYNRQGEDSKRNSTGNAVVPDIVVHRRGTNENYIVIEAKKGHNPDGEDLEKLKRYVADQQYQYAFQLTLNREKRPEDWLRIVQEPESVDAMTNEDWPLVELQDVAEIIMGTSPPSETYNTIGEGLPLINGPVEFGPEPFSLTIVNQFTTAPVRLCRKGDLILCVRGATLGRTNIAGYDGAIGRGVAAIRSAKSHQWIKYCISAMRERIYSIGTGSTFPSITTTQLKTLPIPYPPLPVQEAIVAEIEAEQAIVNANRDLIARMEKKIQATLARVWGEETTAPKDEETGT